MLIPLVLRSVQILFSAIVLGLSITLIKGQVVNGAPATTTYSAFTGGFGMLAALIGFAAVFIEKLNGVVMWAIDALAGVFFLAGGIAIAVALRHVSCSNPFRTQLVDILNGGCARINGKLGCGYTASVNSGKLKSRCQMAEADASFMFLTLLVCAGLIGVGFFVRRRGGGRKAGSV